MSTNLPEKYAFLASEPGPRTLVEALKLFGIKETAGPRSTPEIMAWAKALGLKAYVTDSIPWCGLFAAQVVTAAGYRPVMDPLWALNWIQFGSDAGRPMLGDILVFQRPEGGHVGFYVGEDATHYHVLGGNQGDAVSITRVARERLRGARRAPFRIGQPKNVRSIRMAASGPVSTNEA